MFIVIMDLFLKIVHCLFPALYNLCLTTSRYVSSDDICHTGIRQLIFIIIIQSEELGGKYIVFC